MDKNFVMKQSKKRIVLTDEEFAELQRILRGSIDASIEDIEADPNLGETLEHVAKILDEMKPDMDWEFRDRNLIAAILWHAKEYIIVDGLIEKFIDALLLRKED